MAMAEIEGSLPISFPSVRFFWSLVKSHECSIECHSPRFNMSQFPLRAFSTNPEKARNFAKGFVGFVIHWNRNALNRRMQVAHGTNGLDETVSDLSGRTETNDGTMCCMNLKTKVEVLR